MSSSSAIGAILSTHDPEKIEKLLDRLKVEMPAIWSKKPTLEVVAEAKRARRMNGHDFTHRVHCALQAA